MIKNALLSLILSLFGLPLFAAIPEGVDSVLYIYYRRCNDNVSDARLLPLADTLFQLSVDKNDVRMQAAALSLKTDHYYVNNNLDSLKV